MENVRGRLYRTILFMKQDDLNPKILNNGHCSARDMYWFVMKSYSICEKLKWDVIGNLKESYEEYKK